jgi:hypothetical protein
MHRKKYKNNYFFEERKDINTNANPFILETDKINDEKNDEENDESENSESENSVLSFDFDEIEYKTGKVEKQTHSMLKIWQVRYLWIIKEKMYYTKTNKPNFDLEKYFLINDIETIIKKEYSRIFTIVFKNKKKLTLRPYNSFETDDWVIYFNRAIKYWYLNEQNLKHNKKNKPKLCLKNNINVHSKNILENKNETVLVSDNEKDIVSDVVTDD